MSAEAARILEELREGLAAARRALDRLEDRLGDLEEEMRSRPAEPGDLAARADSPRGAREEFGFGAGPIAEPGVGAEPDLAEFSVGMADEMPSPAAAAPAAHPFDEPEPVAASAAPLDQDDLLKDLFAGTPSSASAPAPFAAESPPPAALSPAVPSDDALEAILKSVRGPGPEAGPPGSRERSPGRGDAGALPFGPPGRGEGPEASRIDFSTDQLEELLGPDRR